MRIPLILLTLRSAHHIQVDPPRNLDRPPDVILKPEWSYEPYQASMMHSWKSIWRLESKSAGGICGQQIVGIKGDTDMRNFSLLCDPNIPFNFSICAQIRGDGCLKTSLAERLHGRCMLIFELSQFENTVIPIKTSGCYNNSRFEISFEILKFGLVYACQ